ncbi:hypothetical protein H6F74_05180 [Trichocoleus sp. FACHB-90]|nr:hypothetical protein [Trichocoleus sp. FACHB-90]
MATRSFDERSRFSALFAILLQLPAFLHTQVLESSEKSLNLLVEHFFFYIWDNFKRRIYAKFR